MKEAISSHSINPIHHHLTKDELEAIADVLKLLFDWEENKKTNLTLLSEE
ncbi:MAG TPA: hypothetical protein VKZ84_06390 [Bacteriovoracaceae bacterium]|nr:hypothetical protein [Bacteriovoracaceae bacterium]